MRNKWNPMLLPDINEYMFYKRKALYEIVRPFSFFMALMSIIWIMRLEKYICFQVLGIDSNTYFRICEIPFAASITGIMFGVYNLTAYVCTLLIVKKYGLDIYKHIDKPWMIKEFGHDSRVSEEKIFRDLCYRKIGSLSLVFIMPFIVNQWWNEPIWVTIITFIGYLIYRDIYFKRKKKELEL